MKAQIFTVAKIFHGEIQVTDLKLQEEELPPIQDEEYLVEALYLSVDPYMKAISHTYKIGQVMVGIQLAKIIESKNAQHPLGELIVGMLGWRTHTIIKPTDNYDMYTLPDIGNLSPSAALGVLGATGISAYFGFLDICKPKENETVVVTAAAGAVGSVVGQIAKIKGCRVIGLTGSEEKAIWLQTLGFDHVINYKLTENLTEELKIGAPNGIDCYFDNVGGEISTTIINLMNQGGRVSCCGSISAYDSKEPVKAGILQPAIVRKQLKLEGFNRRQFRAHWMDGIHQLVEWVQENKIKYRETITEGFENSTKALIGVMKGQNIGKAIVKVKATYVEDESINFKNALNKFNVQ